MTTQLEDLLALTRTGTSTFRGRATDNRGITRLYGGHLVAQSLAAACQTVDPSRHPHSIQTTFLRPAGTEDDDLDYQVDSTREGRLFSTRSVRVVQADRLVATSSVSFAAVEPGEDVAGGMPAVPAPDQLASLQANVAADPGAWSARYRTWRHVDVRHVQTPRQRLEAPDVDSRGAQQVWLRVTERQPDDPGWHRVLLAFETDITLLSAALPALGLGSGEPEVAMASLDHIIWFHRPCRADDWLLHDQVREASSGVLHLVRGRIFDESGRLVASVAQQGLIRSGSR
jgi:acyl-CoA thioesterase-2